MGRALREKNRGGLEWNASLTCLGLLCRLIVLTQNSVWVFVFFAGSHAMSFVSEINQSKNKFQVKIGPRVWTQETDPKLTLQVGK